MGLKSVVAILHRARERSQEPADLDGGYRISTALPSVTSMPVRTMPLRLR